MGGLGLFEMDSSTKNVNDYIPEEQFFNTDYRGTVRDERQQIVDEITRIAPHLMGPPFLVDSNGQPYAAKLQRRVPGREFCPDEFLIPQHVIPRQHRLSDAVDEEEVVGTLFEVVDNRKTPVIRKSAGDQQQPEAPDEGSA